MNNIFNLSFMTTKITVREQEGQNDFNITCFTYIELVCKV